MIRTSAFSALLLATASAAIADEPAAKPPAVGQDIVICGQRFPTGAPVVLWTDPGGYDAYSLVPRFAPPESQPPEKKKPRYNSRIAALPPDQAARVEKEGWDLPTLQGVVDQFVLHFDVCGTSRRCFQVLQDDRSLSVHFMLDLDGTIYQTLDLKERAWHATTSNTRSVGIEIANMGAYAPGGKNPFDRWYVRDADGKARITIPDALGKDSQRDKSILLRPIRDEPVAGEIHGKPLIQYDFTPQQYESLAKLTATLHKAFPKLANDFPRDKEGKLILRALSKEELEKYQGVLGHYHVQTNKVDPGPAFQWERISAKQDAAAGRAAQ